MTERSRALLSRFDGRLALPLIAAPMFLVSGPELARAARRAGVIGSIPFPNARTLDVLEDWLAQMAAEGAGAAPFAANMVTHSSYDRLADEIALIQRYRPEIVITALGGPRPVVEAVHDYGGLVFADVNSIAFARKAAEAGVDGLVLVSAGAGGHTGDMSAFAFAPAVRAFFDGVVVLAGSVCDGRAIRAAEVLGADLAYMGTRFIAAAESLASDTYREMVIAAEFTDLVLSNALTGAHAYYLRASLERMGLDPDNLAKKDRPDFGQSQTSIKAWRDVWSAGHGVGLVTETRPAAEIIRQLTEEYREAVATPHGAARRAQMERVSP
ncbi:MAG: nitronate monooxygenase [Caulobacterales bacterium]|nr:nitronate monooxygenase [Caulobacterales bacterium]